MLVYQGVMGKTWDHWNIMGISWDIQRDIFHGKNPLEWLFNQTEIIAMAGKSPNEVVISMVKDPYLR